MEDSSALRKLETWDKKKFLIQLMRKNFRHTPLYNAAKDKAKHEFFVLSKHGKQLRRVHWLCAGCGRFFENEKDIAVDHIIPVVDPREGFGGIDEWMDRLYCELENLQALCNYKNDDPRFTTMSCHKRKTKEERASKPKKPKKSKKKVDKQKD